jgi:hypothetical protein
MKQSGIRSAIAAVGGLALLAAPIMATVMYDGRLPSGRIRATPKVPVAAVSRVP